MNIDLKQKFLKKHLITYLGNKRGLLDGINEEIIKIKKLLDKETLSSFDGFSGSGVVARLLKYHSNIVYANDLEDYSYIINKAYLSNPTEEEKELINSWIDRLNNMKYNVKGIISNNYSPKDDKNIKKEDRTFYTNENARIIDSMRVEIDKAPENIRPYLLAQLLIKASIHSNTSGVFKGFYKNKKGIGQFGGEAKNALTRITGKIVLDYPIFSEQTHKVNVNVFKEDINSLIKNEKLPEVDITYYDPPYNEHPYSSNYFMLNVILKNELDEKNISKVSGIVKDWNKSDYNYKSKAKKSFKDLLENTRSKFIIISYNNEGILRDKDWLDVLSDYKYEKREIDYNTFRGSRNLKDRSNKVKEILWIIDNRERKEKIEEILDENIEIKEYTEKDLKKKKITELSKICEEKGFKTNYKRLKKQEYIECILNNKPLRQKKKSKEDKDLRTLLNLQLKYGKNWILDNIDYRED